MIEMICFPRIWPLVSFVTQLEVSVKGQDGVVYGKSDKKWPKLTKDEVSLSWNYCEIKRCHTWGLVWACHYRGKDQFYTAKIHVILKRLKKYVPAYIWSVI